MTLRTRLIILLSAFALFALAAASATVYGVRRYVDNAVADFAACMDQTREVDMLRLSGREQLVRLRELVNGRAEAGESYLAHRDAFFTRIEQAVHYGPTAAGLGGDEDWLRIQDLVPKLRAEFQSCLEMARSADGPRAAERLASIESDLWPALDTRLQSARAKIDAQRTLPLNRLVSTNTHLLVLSVSVAVIGAGLVAVGAALLRRWLFVPLAQLKQATRRLGAGDLEHRVRLPGEDELADLGGSMNQMAESLVAAREGLQVSESKFRSLFENLRDAVIICDEAGIIVEHHDGDPRLFGAEAADWRGQPFSTLWPACCAGGPTWSELMDATLRHARRTTATDLPFRRPPEAESTAATARVDLVAYPVQYGAKRYAAIVLREVTERHELQRRVQLGEAMKATITFAQGIAHDFSNLLTSGINTLSRLRAKLADEAARDDAAKALEACRQAARLSNKLLDFAGVDRGRPQTFALSEAVAVILNSLDESFFEHVRLRTDCHDGVLVTMDRDLLTQVVLNLVHNAREAMPDGGELRVTVRYAVAPQPGALGPATGTAPRVHALLAVQDSGGGMTDEVKQKLFEPFYSTKSVPGERRRGMGLAVVYAAVRHADGLIDVQSRLGAGTRFSIFLPPAEGVPAAVLLAAAATAESAPDYESQGERISLGVIGDRASG